MCLRGSQIDLGLSRIGANERLLLNRCHESGPPLSLPLRDNHVLLVFFWSSVYSFAYAQAMADSVDRDNCAVANVRACRRPNERSQKGHRTEHIRSAGNETIPFESGTGAKLGAR